MKIKSFFSVIFLLAATFVLSLAACGEGDETTAAATTTEASTSITATSATTTVASTTEPRKQVALSFDDGPHNGRTKRIVDELAKYGYHATFFVVGNRVDGSEYNGKSGLIYAYKAGNEIGIHGYTHLKYYDRCSDADYAYELSMTEQAIRAVIPGYNVRLMRPVGGAISDSRVSESEYSVIAWNVDSEDWRYKYASGDSDEIAAEKVNTIVSNVMDNVREGSIILMHDIYESTYDAVVIILERLHAEGYDVVTVSELLGDSLEAGRKYSSATARE